MNIFFLDYIPEKCAQFHVDAHVRSGIIEGISCLGFTYDKFPIWPHINNKNKHLNHPVCVWTRSTIQNFDFTLQYVEALINEYNYRTGKVHKCESILNWIKMNLPEKNLDDLYLTNPPRCFSTFKGKIETTDNVVADYRKYYVMSKQHLCHYTKREKPFWWRDV